MRPPGFSSHKTQLSFLFSSFSHIAISNKRNGKEAFSTIALLFTFWTTRQLQPPPLIIFKKGFVCSFALLCCGFFFSGESKGCEWLCGRLMEGAEEEGTGVGGETVIAAIFALFPPRKWRNNGSKRNTFLFAWEMTCFHCFFSFLAAFATNSSFGSNNVSLRAPIVQTEKSALTLLSQTELLLLSFSIYTFSVRSPFCLIASLSLSPSCG